MASPEGLAVLHRSTGTMDLRVPIEQDRPGNRANDVKTDSTGRAWVGTMAYDKRPRNAALYRADGAKVTCAVDGLTICNGPAFDESQGRLYLTDTALFIVEVFDLDPTTGALSGRRRHLNGMVELPVSNPTSVAFGGIGGPTSHHDLVVRLRT